MKKKIVSAMLISAMLAPTAGIAQHSSQNDWTESLNRGLRAVKTADGVYLSWRLYEYEDKVFGSATDNTAFDIYRNGKYIATENNTTNYMDTDGTLSSTYFVVPAGTDVESAQLADNSVTTYYASYEDGGRLKKVVSDKNKVDFEADKVFMWKGMEAVQASDMLQNPIETVAVTAENYLTIPLQKPNNVTLADGNTYEYSAGDSSCGDIDGDGEYEIILKWECNPQDNSNSGYTGNVLLDAYKLDGTFLWRIDLGQNIRSGAHYTQFIVYDLDGDGRAEIGCKTAPGSKDSTGTYVTNTSSVRAITKVSDTINNTSYVDDGGRILKGAEYYTIFDGNGKTIDTIYYPNARGTVSDWGDSYGNRVDRFLATVAYLDGVNPSIVEVRGYYAKTTAASIRLIDGKASVENKFTTSDNVNKSYIGQGNHNITAADVDNDGKDEILSGSLCWDDDLSVLWCSGRGHGDALHIGDYDPTHDGLEYFSVHESGGFEITASTTSSQGKTADYGMTVYDAATGEELYHRSASKDTGRGMMANIGSGGYYQICGAAQVSAMGNGEFTDKNVGMGNNFRIFWDGDLYEEMLNGTDVSSWNGKGVSTIFKADGCTRINGSKSNPSLQADLFGDWREEIVYPTNDGSALRVYMSTEQTDYKMKSLMYDKVYRSGVAAEQTAYNQPPHIGFYLSDDVFYGKLSDIEIDISNAKTTYYIGEALEADGIVVTGKYADNDDRVITGYSVSGYDANKSGVQTITISYLGVSKTYDVTVIGETGISVQCVDNDFAVGDDINKDAFIVKLLYDNGTEKEIGNYKISEYDNLNLGTQSVTITYNGIEATYTEEVEIEFASGIVVQNGSIIGYDGSDENVILPLRDAGKTIDVIADGAFIDTAIKKVYIYNNDITFNGDNIFPSDTIIACTDGSNAYEYASRLGLTVEIISIGDKITFEEDFYSSYVNKNILMQSTSAAGSVADEYVTYQVCKAANNAPWYKADTFGFSVKNDSNNNYLCINAGIYDNMNQFSQVWIRLNDTKNVGEKQTLTFDVQFPSNSGAPYVELQNSEGAIIDTISVSALGLKYDTWYTYELVYDGNTYSATINNNTRVSDGFDNGTVFSSIVFKQAYNRAGNTAITLLDNILIK